MNMVFLTQDSSNSACCTTWHYEAFCIPILFYCYKSCVHPDLNFIRSCAFMEAHFTIFYKLMSTGQKILKLCTNFNFSMQCLSTSQHTCSHSIVAAGRRTVGPPCQGLFTVPPRRNSIL